MMQPGSNRSGSGPREIRYSSGELERLVSALKDQPGEAATLVVLAGASGEQKTVTAEAIAKQLQLDLVRIDLKTVVSKYIAETEKNIDGVFADAERAGAVLLFDESDALFGNRTEPRAGDRNDSAAMRYLLQRIDAYAGIALMIVNDAKPAREAATRLRRASIVVIADG
jgi:SpoVK/Ycf46/Vps4 family AAA+-type ATPase